MNPYQIIGILFGCTLCFAGVVATLSFLGVPVLVAFLGVYFSTALFMLGLQRRALQASDHEYAVSRKKALRSAHQPGVTSSEMNYADGPNSKYAIQPHTMAQFDRLYANHHDRDMSQMSFQPIAETR